MKTDEFTAHVIFEKSPLGIAVLQPNDLHLAHANTAFCLITGYTAEELKNKTIEDLTHREDWMNEKRDVEAVLRGDMDYDQSEKRLMTKSGEAVWVQATIVASRDETGALRSVIQFIEDITAHKRSLQKIEKQEHFVRNVIDADPNLITVKDRKGKYTLVNLAAAEFYGMTVEEMEEMTDAELGPRAGDPEKIRRDDRELLETLRDQFVLEHIVRDATGHSHIWQMYRRPIFVENGEDYQVLTIATDVTEFKKLAHTLEENEKKLLQERALLEDRVKKRVAEFDSKNSEVARAMSLYKKVLGMMQEEIRSTWATALSAAPSPETCRRVQEATTATVDRALDLIHLEAGDAPLKTAAVAMKAFCDAWIQTATTRAQERQLAFENKCDPAVVSLVADEARLQQMLQAILEMAMQTAAAGSALLFESRSDRYCKIADLIIKNSAANVSPESLIRLVNGEEVAADALPAPIQSLRMTLLWVACLVKLHKGTLHLDGDEKTGIRWMISLPWNP